MHWERVIAECYFLAWMTLHPNHLIKLLLRLIVLGVLILTPLIAMNWQLAGRGI